MSGRGRRNRRGRGRSSARGRGRRARNRNGRSPRSRESKDSKTRSFSRQLGDDKPSFFTMAHRKELRHQHDMQRFVLSMLRTEDINEVIDEILPPKEGKKKRTNAWKHFEAILDCHFTVTAKHKRDEYSFQRLIVPFMIFLTSRNFVNGPRQELVRSIFTMIMNHRTFLKLLLGCVEEIATTRNITDISEEERKGMKRKFAHFDDNDKYNPQGWKDIITPTVNLIYILFSESQIGENSERKEITQDYSESLERALESWPYESAKVRREMRYVRSIATSFADKEEKKKVKDDAKKDNRRHKLRNFSPNGWPGPGLEEADSRHDNDFADFRNISILPTSDEMKCLAEPYLPRRGLGSMHVSMPLNRYLDIMFRLTREDALRSIRKSAQAFTFRKLWEKKMVKDESGFRMKLETLSDRKRAERIGIIVYRNLHKVRVESAIRKGVGIRIAFEPPTFLGYPQHRETGEVKVGVEEEKAKEKKTKEKQVSAETKKNKKEKKISEPASNLKKLRKTRCCWWNFGRGSKYLGNDSIVCILLNIDPIDGPSNIIFGTISQRYPPAMSHPTHCEIVIKPIDGRRLYQLYHSLPHLTQRGGNQFLDLSSLRGTGNRSNKIQSKESVMFQVSGHFFAANHCILQALKKPGVQNLPTFMPAIVQASGLDTERKMGKDTSADIPQYITENPDMTFNFQSLVNKEKISIIEQKRFEELKSVRIKDYDSLQSLLRPLAEKGLLLVDPTQADAFAHSFSSKISLIQGPPGTGKTYIGVHIVQCLLENSGERNPRLADIIEVQNNPVLSHRPKLYPILCICYTNHALDQFLEHLLETKVVDLKEVIRVGGRSKSEVLKSRSLREIELNLTRNERFEWTQEWLLSKRLSSEIDNLLEEDSFELFVARMDEDFFLSLGCKPSKKVQKELHEFAGIDNDGFQEVKKKRPGFSKALSKRLGLMEQEESNFIEGITILDEEVVEGKSKDFRRSYNEIATKYRERKREGMHSLITRYEQCVKRIRDIENGKYLRALRQAKIIGVTTSGYAKQQKLFSALMPKVIVCEEAGEVFESHVLSCLSANTQQLILIGDHQQLRPKATEYSLSIDSSRGYDLDISLFESLIRHRAQKIHETRAKHSDCSLEVDTKVIDDEVAQEMHKQGLVSTLLTQRRMRPCISNLIRKTLYPKLEDGEKVLEYPKTKGFASDVWFFDHNEHENSAEGTSHRNNFEANMVVELVKHFVKQGYKQCEIAVLTPYVGQLLQIRKILQKTNMIVYLSEKDQAEIDKAIEEKEEEEEEEEEKLDSKLKPKPNGERKAMSEHVRLATVDNFQGEEAEIVLVSTVRCNNKGSVGFLRISNRVNVMLSRAKHAMIVLGSAETIRRSRRAKMFHEVLKELEAKSCIGPYLPLECAMHGTQIHVKKPTDFANLSPEGGCNKICGHRLECGHTCTRFCHPDDPKHWQAHCRQPCTRLLSPCNHPCEKLCFEDCHPCSFKVRYTPPCGHTTRIFCGTEEQHLCKEIVKIRMPFCNHESQISCYKAKKLESKKQEFLRQIEEGEEKDLLSDIKSLSWMPNCSAVCGQKRVPCGHSCSRKCSQCLLNTWKHINDTQKLQEITRWVSEKPKKPLSSLRDKSLTVVHKGKCQKVCGRNLTCGHSCKWECGDHTRKDAKGRTMCPPCNQPCTTKCAHNKCSKGCQKPCILCSMACTWKCECDLKNPMHCSLPCGVPCLRLPCDNRCKRKLHCGHQCPSLCGETCVDQKYCRECHSALEKNQKTMDIDQPCVEDDKEMFDSLEVKAKGLVEITLDADDMKHRCNHSTKRLKTEKKHRCCSDHDLKCIDYKILTRKLKEKRVDWKYMSSTVDLINLTSLKDHDPNESPIIVLPCGHPFSVETLDGHLGIDKVYERDRKSNKWKACLPVRNSVESYKIPSCPECRAPIKGINRYGRILKQNEILQSFLKWKMATEEEARKYMLKCEEIELMEIKSCDKRGKVDKKCDDIISKVKKHIKNASKAPVEEALRKEVAALSKLIRNMEEDEKDTKQIADVLQKRMEEVSSFQNSAHPPHLKFLIARSKVEITKMKIAFRSYGEERKTKLKNKKWKKKYRESKMNNETNRDWDVKRLESSLTVVLKTLDQVEKIAISGSMHVWVDLARAHGIRARVMFHTNILYLKHKFLCKIEEKYRKKLSELEKWNLSITEKRLAMMEMEMRCKLYGFDKRTKEILENSRKRLRSLAESESSDNIVEAVQAAEAVFNSEFTSMQGGFGSHLKKCPNGHMYLVGECGGAMEESRCPDCGARIGGTQHRNAIGNADIKNQTVREALMKANHRSNFDEKLLDTL